MKIINIRKFAAFFYAFLISLPAGAEVVATASNVHIKTLAASCAACHGTNGNSAGGLPSIANLNPQYFIVQMQAFASGERKASVMHHHAKGLTANEIEQLATYFSAQKPVIAISPKPLK